MRRTHVITSAPSQPRLIARTSLQRVQRDWDSSREPVLVPLLAARVAVGIPAQLGLYFLVWALFASIVAAHQAVTKERR